MVTRTVLGKTQCIRKEVRQIHRMEIEEKDPYEISGLYMAYLIRTAAVGGL